MLHHTVEGPGPERPIRAGDAGPERPHRAGDAGPERPHRAGDAGPDAGARRVVLVHGFTQTGQTWDDVVRRLGDGLEIVRVDLPGHGGSGDVRLAFDETATAIGQVGGPATYVGYSMGGRLCLRLAVDRPDLVSALVLLSASPGLADPDERDARRRSDVRLAIDLQETGTDEFLHHWLAQPMFETMQPNPAEIEARRGNPPEGMAAALRRLGTGVQEPLWDRLPQVAMPVRLVVGEADPKFVAIAERMTAAMGPNASQAILEGAGHAVHLDRPDDCAALIGELVGSTPAHPVSDRRP